MRPIYLILISLGLLSGRADILAQAADEIPPPKPPFVKAVPENAQWTVTADFKAEPKPSPDAPKHHDWRCAEVQTTKVGKVKRDLITTRDGLKQEHWFVDGMLYWTNAQGEVSVTDMRAAEASDPEEDSPSIPSGFPGVGWLKLENYAGVEVFEKQRCYHFAKDGAEAWIDVETKLPVGYRRGKVLYRFTFAEVPSGPLAMPPAYQTALDTMRRMYGIRK